MMVVIQESVVGGKKIIQHMGMMALAIIGFFLIFFALPRTPGHAFGGDIAHADVPSPGEGILWDDCDACACGNGDSDDGDCSGGSDGGSDGAE